MTGGSPRARLREFSHYWIPGLVVFAFLIACGYKPAPLQTLRRVYFDALNRRHPRAPAASPVDIVNIDDESLKRIGQWPWPRTEIAKLVDRVRDLGASAVAVYIVFPEPDRTSPRQLVEFLPADWAVMRKRYLTLHDHDQDLADSLKRGRTIANFLAADRGDGRLPVEKGTLTSEAGAVEPPDFPGAVTNLPVLENAAEGLACCNITDDPDGTARRLPLVCSVSGRLYPGLAAEALRVSESDRQSMLGPAGLTIGPRTIPLESDGSLRLYYAPIGQDRWISAWQLLGPKIPKVSFKNSIVIIALTISGINDWHGTPVKPLVNGAEIHAQAIEQILSGSFLTRPAWAEDAEILCLVSLCLALIWLMPLIGPIRGGFSVLIAAGALTELSVIAYGLRRWLLDPTIAVLALCAVYLASGLVHYIQSRNEKRKLELLDRLKDELISTVSHDLRGPVASVIMYLDAILGGTYGPITDKQRSMLTLLRDSSRRLTFFVSNILDAARIKAGRLKFHMTPVSVVDLFAEADALYLSAAVQKKITLEHRVVGEVPPFDGDREKLEQLINNLVGNAFKFTPKGGRIDLEAQVEGARLRLSVKDTGFGIEPATMPRLFEKFQELDLDRPPEDRAGTGMGLSICKAIIDGHGGEIRVESEKSKGTVVVVFLPLKQVSPS